jgi:hypothetical protein
MPRETDTLSCLWGWERPKSRAQAVSVWLGTRDDDADIHGVVP